MAWDKYMNEVPLKDGVGEYLDWCLSKNIRLGIATSNSRELVNSIARVHGLEHVFQCIMTSCDVGRGKPAPDIYLAVAGQLGIPPRACLVFEDIIPGILAGKAAGMKVCAVEDAYSLEQAEEKKGACRLLYQSFFGSFTGVKVCAFIHHIPSRQSPNIHAGDIWPVARGNKLCALAQG